MRNLTPIHWNEGLFLRPHHFQNQDRYHEDALAVHLDLIDRFHWGVAALEVERSALKNRVFDLSRCALVLPGGEAVLVPENGQADPRSFADHLPPAGKPIHVFLGLPRLKSHEPNVHDPESPTREAVRYRLRTREIHDQASGERPAQVDFLVANLRILFGDEDRGAFDCVKIAEVIQRGSEIFEINEAYVPACLRVDAVPTLLRLASAVRDSLSAKAHELHGLKPDRGDVDPGFLVKLLAVNAHLPVINHLLASGNVHPFRYYEAMAALAGALSSFSSDAEAWNVAPYLHDDPAPAFRETGRRIEEYLDFIVPRKYTEVRLSWASATSCYDGTVSDEHFREGNRFCLALAGSDAPEAVRSQVDRTAKIGAPDRIPQLTRLALRGVAIRALDTAPSEVPRKAAAYFHVEPVGPEWEKVREAKRLAVYLPGAAELSVSLFVIRP